MENQPRTFNIALLLGYRNNSCYICPWNARKVYSGNPHSLGKVQIIAVARIGEYQLKPKVIPQWTVPWQRWLVAGFSPRRPGFDPCRFQWPRGLRRGSAAVRLLGLWVRFPPGAWMFVLCLLYKDSSMEREGQKDLKVQNGSKEKTGQKKNPGSIHVRFVVDKVALGQVFPRIFRFSPVSFIPPVLYYTEKQKKTPDHHLHHRVAQ